MITNHLGICIINKFGNILFADNELKSLFGEDVQKKRCWEVRNPKKERCSFCPLKNEKLSGESEKFESIEFIDGRKFKITHNVNIQNNEKVVMETFEEITDPEPKEKQTNHSDSSLATFFEYMTDAYFQVDAQENIVHLNNAALSMYGYQSENELLGKPASILYANSEERERVIQNLEEKGYLTDVLGKAKRKDGSTFITSINFQYLYDEKGVKIGTQGLFKDIHKRIEAEEAKNELLNRFKLIAKQIPGVIFQYQLRPDGTSFFPYVSERIKDIFNLFPNDVLIDSTPVFKRLHTDDFERVTNSIIESARNLSVWDDSFRLNLPTGKTIWAEGRSTPQRLEDGSTLWHGYVQNITEQKEQEKELLKNRKLLKDSQRAGKIGSWEFHLIEGNLVFQEETYDIFGYHYGEVELNSLKFLKYIVHPDDRNHVKALQKKIVKEKRFIDHEYRIIRKDEKERQIFITGDLDINDEGNIVRTYGIVQDITERKEQQKELLIKQKLLLESQRLAKVGSWEMDLKSFEVIWSEELYKIYELDQNSGKPVLNDFLNLVHPDEKQSAEKHLNNILKNKVFEDLEYRIVTKSGNTKHIFISGEVILDSKGKPIHIYGIVKDRTSQKLYEEELIHAREKAEESNRLKSAFLLNMSHEIRTPMNGILGFMNLLEQPNLNEKERSEYIAAINKSGERLLDTINDIVEISRIEIGDIKINNKEINLEELMYFYRNSFRSKAFKKDIDLKITTMVEGSQALIKTDKEKLEGILIKLIKNAIKFTTQGTIEIGNYIEKDKIYFFIRDTGKGIPENKLEVIFDRFVQVESGNSRSHEGSGIGLSIVKAYVEALSGGIQVQSEVDKGTTFLFYIPYTPVSLGSIAANEAEDEEVDPLNNTILIAEDDEVNFFLLDQILTPKFKLIHAKNGKEAIRLFKDNPDVSMVLMDIKMPGEYSGLEAIQKIRELDKQVPIITQTAYINESYRKKAFEAGCNDYITKPFTAKKLLALVFKYYNRNETHWG